MVSSPVDDVLLRFLGGLLSVVGSVGLVLLGWLHKRLGKIERNIRLIKVRLLSCKHCEFEPEDLFEVNSNDD